MSYLEWDEEYSVNINELDKQHQGLIDIINRLHSAMQQREANEVLACVLNDMLEYTRTHFEEEEALLARYEYPGLENQKRSHQFFLEKLEAFIEEHRSGTPFLSLEVDDFLREWLTRHIMKTDKKYSEFLNEKDVD